MTIHNLLAVVHVFCYTYAKKTVWISFVGECVVGNTVWRKGINNSPEYKAITNPSINLYFIKNIYLFWKFNANIFSVLCIHQAPVLKYFKTTSAHFCHALIVF